MKKYVLMLLVAMVPFLTIAQKRTKKSDKQAIEYMVIKGIEFQEDFEEISKEEINSESVNFRKIEIMKSLKQKDYVLIKFDFGNESNKETILMMRSAQKYSTRTAAANAAARNGWEFVSANVVNGNKGIIHYYYMKRNK